MDWSGLQDILSIACAVTGFRLCSFFNRLRFMMWHYIIRVRKLESGMYFWRSPGQLVDNKTTSPVGTQF
jgi:hypothetical protein